MKKMIFFLLIAFAFCLARRAEAQPVKTTAFAQSISVNLTSPMILIWDVRGMAVDAAKGKSLGMATEYCEEQLKGHVNLNSLQYSEPQCDVLQLETFSGFFTCSVDAQIECH